jgi:hypothetical protein
MFGTADAQISSYRNGSNEETPLRHAGSALISRTS